MKSIKVCEYSRSRSFHYDLILQDQASGERSQDQWSSGNVYYIKLLLLHFASKSKNKSRVNEWMVNYKSMEQCFAFFKFSECRSTNK